MYDFDCGIKPELIRDDLSQQAAHKASAAPFVYDSEVAPNPPGRMGHFEACSQHHGGYCKKDILLGIVETLNRNLYLAVRGFKAVFPIYVEFELLAAGHVNPKLHCMIGRTVGEGRLIWVVKFNIVSRFFQISKNEP